MKAEILHRGFVVLHGWADASALRKEVLTQANAPSTLPMESLSELRRVIYFTFPGEEALPAKANRTLWNLIVKASLAAVDKCSINEDILWHTSTTLLHQD